MPRIRPRWWLLLLVAAILVLVALVARPPARAAPAAPGQAEAETARSLREDLQIAIDTRQATQQGQDDWNAEQTALITRYRELQVEVAYLEERRDAELARLVALEERNSELERRLSESDRLQESLEDTLRRVVERLSSAVADDLPFLPAERSTRLRSVRQELARPEIQAAEKLRRVLEALLVEAQYGGTVEVYRQRIVAAGDTLHADVLRLGSLALFWRTPDGGRIGNYDPSRGEWVDLPGSYHRNVSRAMEMATRRRPVEIIGMPLGEVAP